MSDILKTGAAWLEAERKAFCSSEILYEHDGQSLTVNATWGRTEYEVVDESGVSVASYVLDFLITATDLPEAPELADRIEADGVEYEVMALGGDAHGWRWSDPYRKTYRVHAKQVST